MWASGYDYLADELPLHTPQVLSTQDEGNVMLYPSLGVVVKERTFDWEGGNVCNICVRREFDLGQIANSYESPYLVETLGYFERDVSSFVVTKYVPGTSLTDILEDSQPLSSHKDLILKIFSILKGLQDLMSFTHYDLHTDNIIITPDGTPVFIDLSRSYINGMYSSFAESAILDSSTTPGVFDPIFDLAFLLSDLFSIFGLPRDHRITDLYDRNNIDIYTGYPYRDDIYEIDELFTNGKIWASTVSGKYSMATIYHAYALSKIFFAIKSDIKSAIDLSEYYSISNENVFDLIKIRTISEEDASERDPSIKYKDEFIANLFTIHSPEFDYIRNRYIILLGEAAVHDKLIAMNNRPDNAHAFHQAVLLYLQ